MEGYRRKGKKRWLACGYGAVNQDDIMVFWLEKGNLQVTAGIRQGDAPSFACVSADKMLYTVSERSEGAYIYRYEIEGDSPVLQKRMKVPGDGLCHLHAGQTALFGSCYLSGHFFAVDYALTKILWLYQPPKSSAIPHAHWIETTERLLYAADLGRDIVRRFELKYGIPQKELSPLPAVSGAGPRQPLCLAGGGLAVANELNSTISFYRDTYKNEKPLIRPASANTQQPNYPGGACQTSDGTIYLCNRGANTAAAFSTGGKPLGEWAVGDWPRGIAADEEWVLAACQRSNEVLCLRRYEQELQREVRMELAGASCVISLPFFLP